MGATLTTDSAVGVGSCFTLELAYDAGALIDVGERAAEAEDAVPKAR